MINRFLLVLLTTLSIQSAIAGSVGGITGGGGNTVPGNPITPYELNAMLAQAPQIAYLFFGGAGRTWFPHQVGINLDSINPVFALIRNTKIYTATDSSCLDKAGNETDGSIVSPVPNTICISLKNLTAKLGTDNAWVQTMALVIHEYSHLIGTNESQATALQQVAIQELNSKSVYRDPQGFFSSFFDSWFEMTSTVPRIENFDLNKDADKILGFVSIHAKSVFEMFDNQMFKYDSYFGPSVFSFDQRTILQTLLAKWEIIRIGVKLEFWGDLPESCGSGLESVSVCYNRAFNGKSEVTVAEFNKIYSVTGGRPIQILPNVTVKKIATRHDVETALNELKNDLDIFYKQFRSSYLELIGLN